jgi:hypothetical protein
MPAPGPLRPSTVFVQMIVSCKCEGVSLMVSRRNWPETAPGEEKVVFSPRLTAIRDTFMDC